MFTGIVEAVGIVKKQEAAGTNRSFWIESPISAALKVDQSLSHEGVCLTVEAIEGNTHRVTAIEETIRKTNLASWAEGRLVNLERCMQMNGRLDGHIVQGHVDATGTCTAVVDRDGSREYSIAFDPAFAHLVIEKGSISLNGTSLTVFNVQRDRFTIAIIPYTFEHTSIRNVVAGDQVNLEFDIIGKYISRMSELKNA